MLRRFAAATAVASAAVGIVTVVVLVLPGLPRERFAPLLFVWCLAPAVWGLWAMLAPRAWVPDRLPTWGMILGVLPATLVFLVLDLPSRVAGVSVAVVYRAVGAALLVVFYYLLWMLVRRAVRALA